MRFIQVATLITALLLSGNGSGIGSESEPVPAEVPADALLPARADEPESLKPADELARLRKTWDGWNQKATSIEVEGFEFYGILRADNAQVPRESLLKLALEDLPKLVKENPKYDLAALNAATAEMFPRPDKENVTSATYGRWAEISLVRAADNVKWMMVLGNTTMTTIRRGPIEQSYSTGNRQASVYSQNGGLRIPGTDMFLYGPKLASESRPWRILETQPTKRQLLLEVDGGKAVQLDYEAVSGSVSYHGLRLSDTQMLRERFQSAEVFTPNGVPVPRIVTEITYDAKQPPTRRVTIYVITAVDIGNKIDRTEFDLSVPMGTNVVLFEGAPGKHPAEVRPAMAFTKNVVEDAAEFTRSEEFQRAQRK